MTQDARTLQLLLHLCGRSLADFNPKPLPRMLLRFLDTADRSTLQSCLVETLCRLENMPPLKKALRPAKLAGRRTPRKQAEPRRNQKPA